MTIFGIIHVNLMFIIDSRENISLDLMEFMCTVRNRTEEAPTIINTRK
ncbi:MAG: hypothetical protein K0Q49_1770, partial [Haloplasmataceae bacterium]|nr:hypothetical protein [Haloplasmataceae bacterium]